VKLDEFRYGLAKMPQGEALDKAKNDMTAWVAEEIADVGREYELFLHEHVENTRAARMAATAPSQAQWGIIIRQQNSLDRQLERKIRLLMELQRERKSEAQESLEASSPPVPGDPQDGATGVRSCRRRTRAPAAVHPSTTGMAQTSSCEVCDVPKGQAGTPIAGGTAERDEGGSADPRFWGPRFFRGATDKPRTPTPGVRATQLRALLICLGAVLAAFKKIKNRGNELKDLLQRQGITEIATSKRTHFRAERAAIGAARSGISRIVGGRLAVPWLERSYTIRGRASPTPARFRSRGAAPEGSPRRKPWDRRTAFVSAAPEGRQRQCRGICRPSRAYTTRGSSSIPRLTPWATLCRPSGPLEVGSPLRG
jgi:hypothetical protein